MKLRVILALLVLLLASKEVSAAPKIELTPQSWDMGEIYQWTNPSVLVKIKNPGDQDLVIKDVRVSCGCTAVILSEKVIKPGTEGTMKISFGSYNFRGPVRKNVVLVTNDPAAGNINFDIKGRIKDDRAAVGVVEPEAVDLGIVAPYETRFFMITIRNAGNMDMKLRGAELPPGFFLESPLPTLIPVRGEASARIGYKPQKASGPFAEEALVRQADESQGKMALKITGYIAETKKPDSVTISPAGIKISPGTPNPEISVAVKNEGQAAVSVESADSSFDLTSPAAGNIQIKPGETGSVQLKLSPDGLKENTKGFIYIRLAIPVEVEGSGRK